MSSFCAQLLCADLCTQIPKAQKDNEDLTFFALLGSSCVIAAHKNIDEIDQTYLPTVSNFLFSNISICPHFCCQHECFEIFFEFIFFTSIHIKNVDPIFWLAHSFQQNPIYVFQFLTPGNSPCDRLYTPLHSRNKNNKSIVFWSLLAIVWTGSYLFSTYESSF